MALSIIFDHEQRRVSGDRLAVMASGIEFDPNTQSADAWIDPVTETLFLKPRPVYAAWYTTGTGDYAKGATSDFTWADSSKWETRQDQHWKGAWIATIDSTYTGTGVTNTTYSKNRGFYLAIQVYGSQAVYQVFECGWNNTATASTGVSVAVYSDGTLVVSKTGVIIGQVKITGSKTAAGQTNSVLEFMLIPCRHRELLIVGLNGDGGSIVFEDIDDSDTNPTITSATKFWVEAVAGGCQFQIAALKFATSGYASSYKMSFVEAPATGETLENWTNPSPWTTPAAYAMNGHQAYVGTQTAVAALKQWDGTTFTPNGTRKNCRVRVDMTTSDAGYSPSIYSAQLSYPPVVELTDDSEEFDVIASVEECSFSVPEDPANVGLDLVLVDPQTLESDVALVRRLSNRPVKVKLGSVTILDGRTNAPEWEQQMNSAGERCHISVDDPWKALENYIFADRYLLDYLLFDEAIKLLVKLSGIAAANLDVSTTTFSLDPDAGSKTSDHAFLIEAGDRASDWVKRLFDDLAADWWWGFKPTATGVKFFAKKPADLSSTPALTLYPTIAAAVAGGVSAANASRFVFRKFRQTILEPEANDIRVTGWNSRDQRPFQFTKIDTASVDPTTVPSVRPLNWVGENRKYGLVDPSIRTELCATNACNYLYNRLSVAREMAEIECELLLDPVATNVPLWRGDVITLSGKGNYRINSFGCDFVKDVSGVYWRTGVYTLEKI